MTIIYLIRHSEPMNQDIKQISNHDSLQTINEKNILSVIGEEKAKLLSKNKELQNIDYVISSNYTRAMATAKYICKENNKELNIIEDFGERKFGINNWNELPQDFGVRQFEDENYKIGNGESQKEVASRMYNALMDVVNKYQDKKIVIVSHATAITFLLMKLGTYQERKIIFNNKILIDETFKWQAPEVFKLQFEQNNLISIENINNFININSCVKTSKYL